MSDNKHPKRPAYSSIPSAPLHFKLSNNAVRKAERDFHQRWSTLTASHYGILIHDLYLPLLATPILGELVNELELVLNQSVRATSNNLTHFLNMQPRENRVSIFFVRIPSNEPIYHEMAPINTVRLRVKMNIAPPGHIAPSPSGITTPPVGLPKLMASPSIPSAPVCFETAVRASDSGMHANDSVLLRGSLSNICLFHILELLMVIHDVIVPVWSDSPHKLFNNGERTPIWDHILPAIVAYTLRSFCTDWGVGESWNGVDGAWVVALLEDPRNDKRIQKLALRFVRAFLQRWSTSACPDLSGWKDMYQWVDYERLTLRSWPMVCRAQHICPVLFHKLQCRDSHLSICL